MECCDSATSFPRRPSELRILGAGGRNGLGDRLDFDAFRRRSRNAPADGASAVQLDRGGEHALPDVWDDDGVQFRGSWKPLGFLPNPAAWSTSGSGDGDGGIDRRVDRGFRFDARSVLFGVFWKTVFMGIRGVAPCGMGLQDR